MSAKQLIFEESARQGLLRGVQQLSRAVKATPGPKGRNVVFSRKFGCPTVTKDGVTVAKEIELHSAYENMGAQMVREVASKTCDDACDGTTTATLLAEAIYREGLKFVTAGANPIGIQRGIQQAVATCLISSFSFTFFAVRSRCSTAATEVTRAALQNAASIAGLLLTTECLVTETQEKKDESRG